MSWIRLSLLERNVLIWKSLLLAVGDRCLISRLTIVKISHTQQPTRVAVLIQPLLGAARRS